MWRALNDLVDLQSSFVASIAAMHPFYAMRAIGGMFFLTGMLLMAYNVFVTIRQGVRDAELAQARTAVAAA